MANNPQGPEGQYDPAGSTQMFRAFVDEGGTQSQQSGRATPTSSGGPRIGVIVGVIIAIAAVAAVAWLALG